ncbi:hypothetical protein, partial [Aeromonas simiae]|uniref:hypothetical protein n=1 Tax=Aeromonas simiae TaxID=218936 RepID=UPI001E429A85
SKVKRRSGFSFAAGWFKTQLTDPLASSAVLVRAHYRDPPPAGKGKTEKKPDFCTVRLNPEQTHNLHTQLSTSPALIRAIPSLLHRVFTPILRQSPAPLWRLYAPLI